MPEVVPDRAHPEFLHIRPYAGAAAAAHKALKALILKRRPPLFARDYYSFALFFKPVEQEAVERIAVRDRRQVGVCVDRVDDKAAFR